MSEKNSVYVTLAAFAALLMVVAQGCLYTGVPVVARKLATLTAFSTPESCVFVESLGAYACSETNTADFAFAADGNGVIAIVDPITQVSRRIGQGHLHNPLGLAAGSVVGIGEVLVVVDRMPEARLVVLDFDGNERRPPIAAAQGVELNDCTFVGLDRVVCTDSAFGSNRCRLVEITSLASPTAEFVQVLDTAEHGCAHANPVKSDGMGGVVFATLGTRLDPSDPKDPSRLWSDAPLGTFDGGVFQWSPTSGVLARWTAPGGLYDGIFRDSATGTWAVTDLRTRSAYGVSPLYRSDVTNVTYEPLWDASAIVPQLAGCDSAQIGGVDTTLCGTFNVATQTLLLVTTTGPGKAPLSQIDEQDEASP